MKVVISPAKSLDFNTNVPVSQSTMPDFLDQAIQIQRVLKTKTPKQLSDLMTISDKLAQLNWDRNQEWQVPFPEGASKQAIFAFNGDVYTGLDAYTLNTKNIEKAQQTIRILSGLYGLIKPLDLIMPYRLEMGTKLPIDTSKDLYAFWQDTITNQLNNELAENELLVNLASNEYASAINFNKIKSPVITPEFKDYKDGKLKIISFYAKKARGLMSRYIIENDLQDIESLKQFNVDGYRLDENLTKNNQFVFTR